MPLTSFRAYFRRVLSLTFLRLRHALRSANGYLWNCTPVGSYRKQPLDAVSLHIRPRAALDDLAALHHQVLVGERAREIVVLLDQQDRHVAARGERADRALDVLDDRGLDALGRLVEDQELRPHRERAAD